MSPMTHSGNPVRVSSMAQIEIYDDFLNLEKISSLKNITDIKLKYNLNIESSSIIQLSANKWAQTRFKCYQ